MPFEDIKNRSDSQQPQLVGDQLRFLLQGRLSEPKREREGSIVDTICNEKVPLISQRFKWLIEDLAVLEGAASNHEKVSLGDGWRELYDDLGNLHQENVVFRDGNVLSTTRRVNTAFFARVGIQAGHLARLLLSHPLQYATNMEHEIDMCESVAQRGMIFGFNRKFYNSLHRELSPGVYDENPALSRWSVVYTPDLSQREESLAKVASNSLNYVSDTKYNEEKALDEAGLPKLSLMINAVEKQTDAAIETVGEFVVASELLRERCKETLSYVHQMADIVLDEIDYLQQETYKGDSDPVTGMEVFCAISEKRKVPETDNNRSIKSIINEWRKSSGKNVEHVSEQEVRNLKNRLKGNSSVSERWKDYPLLQSNDQPTPYGQFIEKIIRQRGDARKTNRYLPTDTVPGEKWTSSGQIPIEVACWAFAVNEPEDIPDDGKSRKELFAQACESRVPDDYELNYIKILTLS